jgi:hypothetical protein
MGADGTDDPFPCLLEAVLVQGEARQLLLHLPVHGEVRWGKIRIEGAPKQLDAVVDELLLHNEQLHPVENNSCCTICGLFFRCSGNLPKAFTVLFLLASMMMRLS